MNRLGFSEGCAVALCGVLAACVPNPVTNAASVDSKVYEAFFGGRQLSETVYVADSSLTFDAFATGPGIETAGALQRLESEGVPNELASSLARASSQKRPTSALSLPQPVHILKASELKEIFSQNLVVGWADFYRRYPSAKGYQAFSPIGYSADRTNALFYHEHACGGLCGSGELVWVSRAPDGQWKVHKRLGLWIS
jgi:hypothetical protein